MGYQVDHNLYDRALNELFARDRPKFKSLSDEYIRQGAKKGLDDALWYAFSFHEKHPAITTAPTPRSKLLDRDDLSPRMRETIEATDKKFADSRREMDEMLAAKHRRSLISFLTLDQKVSQQLAEQIVDQCILSKVEA